MSESHPSFFPPLLIFPFLKIHKTCHLFLERSSPQTWLPLWHLLHLLSYYTMFSRMLLRAKRRSLECQSEIHPTGLRDHVKLESKAAEPSRKELEASGSRQSAYTDADHSCYRNANRHRVKPVNWTFQLLTVQEVALVPGQLIVLSPICF